MWVLQFTIHFLLTILSIFLQYSQYNNRGVTPTHLAHPILSTIESCQVNILFLLTRFGYQKTSHCSLGLLDPGSIIHPGTPVPQSKAFKSTLLALRSGRLYQNPPFSPQHFFLITVCCLSLLSLVNVQGYTAFPEGIPTKEVHLYYYLLFVF